MNKSNVITDQELFFNQNSLAGKKEFTKNIFYYYANKEQIEGFNWIEDKKNILEYGCGSGTSLDIFFEARNLEEYFFYGVDIAEQAVKKAKEYYPGYTFYKIKDNKIPQIEDGTLDAAFMLHVLHHSFDHEDIFSEIYQKLKPGGKFFLSDLSSNNIFIRLGRNIFALFPAFFKNKFPDDLVVDGKIPEKYPVDYQKVAMLLRDTGFEVQEIGHGHVFFFLFGWLDRFVPLTKVKHLTSIYPKIMKLEERLLKHNLFKKQAEVFYIKSVK